MHFLLNALKGKLAEELNQPIMAILCMVFGFHPLKEFKIIRLSTILALSIPGLDIYVSTMSGPLDIITQLKK